MVEARRPQLMAHHAKNLFFLKIPVIYVTFPALGVRRMASYLATFVLL
jgi:hypothetical protein